MNRPMTLTLAAACLVAGLFWVLKGGTPASLEPGPATVLWQIDGPMPADRAAFGAGYDELPTGLVHPLAFGPKLPAVGALIAFPLPDQAPVTLEVTGAVSHANGDSTLHARGSGDLPVELLLTQGARGVFGQVSGGHGRYQVHSDTSGSFLVDLNDARLDVDNFHADTLNQPALHPMAARLVPSADQHVQAMLDSVAANTTGGDAVRVDLMFIYTPAILARYPGGLLETRLNHLVEVANQSFANSQIDLVIRLVHHQAVAYDRSTSNPEALDDLVAALRGQPVAGLDGLDELRDEYGADIISLIWPNELESRLGCGVAMFPQALNDGWDPSMGVNVVNDGVSNWSVCTEITFAHELGHNFNAEHQRSQASADLPERYNYAFGREQRFHTIMSQYGSLSEDRYMILHAFSNPDIQCGGEPCGSMVHGQAANNALEISNFAPIIAAYSEEVVSGPLDAIEPDQPDSDGDGVSDWDDPFPFDALDGELAPELPALAFQPRQLKSGDDTGDYELLVLSSGKDQVRAYDLHGHFRGIAADATPINLRPVLTDGSDFDLDDQGRIYILASGEVQTYDRASGQRIERLIRGVQPDEFELISGFPRSLILDQDQLIVLGYAMIERYQLDGQVLAWPTGGFTKEPSSWGDLLDLPLRAIASHGERLYLAEAEFNRILVFDNVSGERLDDLAPADNGLIVDPRGLAVDPTGQVYLANGAANNVLRFDPDQPDLVEEFVVAGAGELSFARALSFGPDGHLYVASRDNSRVLRFDGDSGAFIDTVVTDGIDQPESLRFAPALDQILPGHSGHYFLPERSGEGWLLEVLSDSHAAISWFTYPPETAADGAGQAWMVGVGEIDGGRIVFDEMLSTRGPGFDSDFDPDALELLPWGRIEFEFANCHAGRMHYQGPEGFGAGSLDFVRLIEIAGLPCGDAARAPSANLPGVSGQWLDPEQSGQGWFLEEFSPGQVFAAWFTYDSQGRQAWFVGNGELDGRVLHFDELLITRGTHFGQDFDAEQVELSRWGEMTWTFHDCERASITYQSDLSEYGSGSFEARVLTRLAELECQFTGD